MIALILATATFAFAVLAIVHGRRLGQAAVRRREAFRRRRRHERDVSILRRRRGRREKSSVELPQCDQCHGVFAEIAELRQHLETHR